MIFRQPCGLCTKKFNNHSSALCTTARATLIPRIISLKRTRIIRRCHRQREYNQAKMKYTYLKPDLIRKGYENPGFYLIIYIHLK